MKKRIRRSRPYRGILLKPLPPRDDPGYDQELQRRVDAVFKHHNATRPMELLAAMLIAHVPAFHTKQPPPAGPNTSIEDQVDAFIESVFPATRPAGRPPVFTEIGLSIAELRRVELKKRNPRMGEVEICRHLLKNSDFYIGQGCCPEIGDGNPKTLARLLSERRRKLLKKDSATKP